MLGKETDIQIQKAQEFSKPINPKKPTPRNIIIKKVKDKERMLKAVRKKKLLRTREKKKKNKGTSVRLSADFFDRNFCRSKGNGTIYSKYWEKKKRQSNSNLHQVNNLRN